MTADVPERYEIHEKADHLEVVGLSHDEMQEALKLYRTAQEKRLTARDSLHALMLEADLPLVSDATQRQAQRNLALREELLTTQGFQTYESLADRRDTLESSVRTWVSRLREKGSLFTVKHRGTTLIPSVQLLDSGQLNTAVAELIRPLRASGIDGWALWAWLCNPTGLLSGDVPAEVAATNPKRALRAAERSAASNWRPDAEAS
ncbi:hypothetical protein GCM10009720_25700 [Yaniella flava]|uniref:Uncharacterized protein n=1 Tax=Yaniella flava TaxID=287930 RepID=A0ABN2UW95_9MICC